MIPVTERSRVQFDVPLDLKEFDATGIVVVVDERVDERFASGVVAAARNSSARVTVHPVTGGEALKGIDGWRQLLERFQDVGLDRRGLVVAVGGGSVADVAGFAAASWLRGVDWVGVPTTLLGMVDAHIGGKTGINLAGEKNRVGAFHVPRLVHVDRVALVGLPERELASGWGEVLKTALIADAELFQEFEAGARGPGLANEPSRDTITRCVAVKAGIVSDDLREGGRRRVLNLGHTLAHALEAQLGIGEISHGEAVAIGLVFACRVAHHLGIGEASLEHRVRALLQRWQLRDGWPVEDVEELLEYMSRDKKTVDEQIHMALPVTVGQIEVHSVEPEALATCLLATS